MNSVWSDTDAKVSFLEIWTSHKYLPSSIRSLINIAPLFSRLVIPRLDPESGETLDARLWLAGMTPRVPTKAWTSFFYISRDF